jgi:glutaredoxin 3
MTATTNSVEIYTTKVCPFCLKAKKLLDSLGASYQEISVDDEEDRKKMVERTGGARSVPQIFIEGKLVDGGCDGLYDLHKEGKLKGMLGLQ